MTRLEEIEKRHEAATAGPWTPESYEESYDETHIALPNGRKIHFVDQPTYDDIEFIAHARDDIPFLLEEIKRLSARAALVEEPFVKKYEASLESERKRQSHLLANGGKPLEDTPGEKTFATLTEKQIVKTKMESELDAFFKTLDTDPHAYIMTGDPTRLGVAYRWAWKCRCGARSARNNLSVAEAGIDFQNHKAGLT